MKDIKFKIKLKYTDIEITEVFNLLKLLTYHSEEIFEKLEDTGNYGGCDGNCTNESQNFCDCASVFEDAEIVGIKLESEEN